MNTKYILDTFQKIHKDLYIEIDKDEPGQLIFHAPHCTVRPFDDDILIRFIVMENGFVFEAIFDSLEITSANLWALNTFNQDNTFFTAFISEHAEGVYLLHIRAAVTMIENEEQTIDSINFYLATFLSDMMEEYLLPLTQLTK